MYLYEKEMGMFHLPKKMVKSTKENSVALPQSSACGKLQGKLQALLALTLVRSSTYGLGQADELLSVCFLF